MLVVNAHTVGVTTAIVRSGIVLLHRSVELTEFASPTPANMPAALFQPSPKGEALLPLVDPDATQAEWAAQEPLPQFGRNPYTDQVTSEEAAQNEDGFTGSQAPASPRTETRGVTNGGRASHGAGQIDMYAAEESLSRLPYASAMLQQELDAQLHNSPYLAPSAEDTLSRSGARESLEAMSSPGPEPDVPVHTLAPDAREEEIARAVSVAIAFFEDTLAAAPPVVLSAGPVGAEALGRTLRHQGLLQESTVQVRELVDNSALAATATTSQVPRSWLAGVTGALKS